MSSGNVFKKLSCTYLWGNVLAIVIIILIFAIGVKYGIDLYTHHGESIVVPNIIHKQYDEAASIMEKAGLTIEVTDTGYVKELPPDCILEQTPLGGKRVKSTHVIYVTINAASVPTLVIPDIDAKIILQVGDGTREVGPNETLNEPQYEDIEVEKKAPEYDEVYEYVEVPVDENGNEIKPEQNHTVPSIPPPSKEAVPSEKPAEE